MQFTIELPETITSILEARAALLGLSVERLAANIVVDGLEQNTQTYLAKMMADGNSTINEARAKLAAKAAEFGLTHRVLSERSLKGIGEGDSLDRRRRFWRRRPGLR